MIVGVVSAESVPPSASAGCPFCDPMLAPENRWLKIAIEVAALVAVKNAAYGSSFAKSGAVLRILYPEGVKPEQFDDLLTIARVLDKLFRIATDRDALGESPWRDVLGYALLAVERVQGEKSA